MAILRSLSELSSTKDATSITDNDVVDILYFEEAYEHAAQISALLANDGYKVSDASDGIHGSRLLVECPQTRKDTYLQFLARQQLINTSFHCGMLRYSKEGAEKLIAIIKLVKGETQHI
jgi:hypothetical protein